MRTLAPRNNIFRTSTRCCSPTESCQIFARGFTFIPYCSPRAATWSSILDKLKKKRGFLRPRTTFSATEFDCTSIKCWWIIPIPCEIASWGEWKATRLSLRRISPPSGRYKPAKTFINVLLPAPFSPNSACTCPSRQTKSTWSIASTPGKRFTIARISKAVGDSVIYSPKLSILWLAQEVDSCANMKIKN